MARNGDAEECALFICDDDGARRSIGLQNILDSGNTSASSFCHFQFLQVFAQATIPITLGDKQLTTINICSRDATIWPAYVLDGYTLRLHRYYHWLPLPIIPMI